MMLPRSPFAGATLPRHLARGGAGLLALACSVGLMRMGGPLGILGAVSALGFAVVLLRGCPMCWVIGLIETVALRRSHELDLIRSGKGERP